jgi:UDP-glucose 4-epimerase
MAAGPVLVSGAAGFVGRAVTRRLARSGVEVVVALRRPQDVPGAARAVTSGDLAAPAPVLETAMRGVSAVVHAAGRAHRLGAAPAALAAANVTAAESVARIAARRGVGLFVLVSSAAVFGKRRDEVIDEASATRPDDDYASSKLAGEAAVRDALDGTATRLVVVRPCAVVGPGCAGNVPRLVRLVATGMPLPFGAIRNRRSFIAVDDLAALIEAVVLAETPPGCVIAAHPEPVSTPELIRALARGLGRRPVLLPVPAAVLAAASRWSGRGALWDSFAGSLQADPRAAREDLGFSAATPVVEALAATASALR